MSVSWCELVLKHTSNGACNFQAAADELVMERNSEIELLRKALVSSCDEQRQLYREEANSPCEAAIENEILKDEIERLCQRLRDAGISTGTDDEREVI